jgi:hypothetical protein
MKKEKRERNYLAMSSWELLHELFIQPQVKNLAAKLGRSAVLLYKWAEPRGGDHSGKKNPLDWLVELMALTDERLVHWVCAKKGGFFVRNPVARRTRQAALRAENSLLEASGKFFMAVTAFLKPGGRTSENAARLRTAWEVLKSAGESFVCGCERGLLHCGALFVPLLSWLGLDSTPLLAEV